MRNDEDRPLLPERLFLTLAEAGAALGVGPSRAQQLVKAGLLPHVRLGRRILVPRRALEAMADEAVKRARAIANGEG